MLSKPLKEAIDRAVAVDVLCSGEFGMQADSAVQGANDTPGNQGVEQVLGHLAEAIGIVDALKLSPEIGAKLQEAISAIEEGARA